MTGKEELQAKVVEAAKFLVSIPNFVETCAQCSPVPDPDATAAEWIWARLASLGIYQDDDSYGLLLSDDCSEGEARRQFCENGEPNVPVVRFKRVWSILRRGREADVAQDTPVDGNTVSESQKEGLKELGQQIAGALKPIGQWSDQELLDAYTFECENGVIEELDRRANGNAFVIFESEAEGLVDVDASLRMLREARRGRTLPVTYKMADILKKLYRAGEFPGYVMHECPFHPSVVLLAGYCDKCGHTWEAVPYEIMQFARIVLNQGDAPDKGPGIRQFISSAMRSTTEEALASLNEDYSKAALAFSEAKQDDTLPNLKRRISTTEDNSGGSDPFNPGSHKRW